MSRACRPLGKVRANPVGFDQAVLNLLQNALRYAKPDVPTRLKIWSEARPDVLRLWIELPS